MKYLSVLMLLYQRIFVFYSNLRFPRDLHWSINFQILYDQTINFPYIDRRSTKQGNLNHVQRMRSLGRAVKLNL